MTDREIALKLLHEAAAILGDVVVLEDFALEVLADAMLEFSAKQVETVIDDPTFRADELRAQIKGQV